MSLKPVYDKLQLLSEANSAQTKKQLLKDFLTDPLFRTTAMLSLDPGYTFHINKLPKFKNTGVQTPGNDILNKLIELSIQRGIKKEEKDELFSMIPDKETWEVVRRIVTKRLGSGIAAKTVNKVEPGLITIIPYMRCSSQAKIGNITFPAMLQPKADGVFAYAYFNAKDVGFMTRNGSDIVALSEPGVLLYDTMMIQAKALGLYNTRYVLMGELLVRDENGFVLPRKKGNGIINKCIKDTATKEELNSVCYSIWDCVTYEVFVRGMSTTPYMDRYEKCREIAETHRRVDVFEAIITHIVRSNEDIAHHYRAMRLSGEEGCVVKNKYGIWKDGTSKDQIKIKNESDCELRIKQILPGKQGTKYEHCVGSLILESDDGKVKVQVSSGLTDRDRESIDSDCIGKLATVRYESVIDSDSRDGVYSLFLPRLVEIRFDKDGETDTLEYIKENCL